MLSTPIYWLISTKECLFYFSCLVGERKETSTPLRSSWVKRPASGFLTWIPSPPLHTCACMFAQTVLCVYIDVT